MAKANTPMAGVVWKFAERICAQGVSFIVSVALARLLLPEEYGIISLVMVFIGIANILVTNGLGLSLVQKNNSDELDFSTIFFCSVVLGIVIYVLLFLGAPYIAQFYSTELLCPVTRVLGLRIILASVNSIQQAYVSKTLQFEKFFFATLIGTVISGVVGLAMAFHGYGVWALVFQYLTNSFIDSICLFISVKWYPKLMFSWERAKSLLNYAWKVMASGFVNTATTQIRHLFIGKLYSPADLAFYEKGNFFPQTIMSNLNTAISDVSLPFMAKYNTEPEKLKEFSRKSLRATSYVVTPLLFGLFIVADETITLLLTEKWIDCVVFLRIMCLYWLAQPIQTINWQILKATGKADMCLKLELLKKTVDLCLLLLVMNISVAAIAWTSVAMAVLSVFLNAAPVSKNMGYSIKEQLRDIIPSFLLSIIMAIVVLFIKMLPLGVFPKLVFECVTGIMTYILLSVVTHNKEFYVIFNKIKSVIQK